MTDSVKNIHVQVDQLCPFCYSDATIRTGPTGKSEYHWACGAYATVSNFAKHGEGAVIDYNANCDYISALRKCKSMIEQNHWRKVDYKGQLVGGGGHGNIEETYQAICDVLP